MRNVENVGPDKRKILIINQYFPPDLASTGMYAFEIAKGLRNRGLEVYVICAKPSYTQAKINALDEEVIDGIHVFRINLGMIVGREKILIRISGYLGFLIRALIKGIKITKSVRPSYLLSFHNPPLLSLLGTFLSRRYRMKYTYVPYELHPEALLLGDWKVPKLLVLVWERINSHVYGKCDRIIVLTEPAKAILIEKYKVNRDKVHVVPLWAIPEFAGKEPDRSIFEEFSIKDDELICLYAGNMGIMHPLDPVIDAATFLKDVPVRFLFLGGGVGKNHLLSRIKNEDIKNITLLNYQPEEKFKKILGMADVAIVSFKYGMDMITIPSRIYTFLSAGKPIIGLMNPAADIARLISNYKCGWIINSSSDMAKLIMQLISDPGKIKEYGANSLRLYSLYFRKDNIVGIYYQIITS